MNFKVACVVTGAAIALLIGSAAQASTVLNTELGPVPAPGVTTTDATGTRSTKAGSGNVSEILAPNEWQQRNLRGGAEIGITTDFARSGNGSVSFYNVDGGSKADMEYYFSTSFLLSDFEGASYDWYRDAGSTNPTSQVPGFRLATDLGTYLIFEPVYNGVAVAPTNAWTTSVIGASTFLWANNTGSISVPALQSCTPSNQCASLAAWQNSNPTAKVIGFSTGIGSGWNGAYAGAVDNVSFTFGGKTESFNFEVASGAVPEPSTWAMMLVGFGGLGAMLRHRRVQRALAV